MQELKCGFADSQARDLQKVRKPVCDMQPLGRWHQVRQYWFGRDIVARRGVLHQVSSQGYTTTRQPATKAISRQDNQQLKLYDDKLVSI